MMCLVVVVIGFEDDSTTIIESVGTVMLPVTLSQPTLRRLVVEATSSVDSSATSKSLY